MQSLALSRSSWLGWTEDPQTWKWNCLPRSDIVICVAIVIYSCQFCLLPTFDWWAHIELFHHSKPGGPSLVTSLKILVEMILMKMLAMFMLVVGTMGWPPDYLVEEDSLIVPLASKLLQHRCAITLHLVQMFQLVAHSLDCKWRTFTTISKQELLVSNMVQSGMASAAVRMIQRRQCLETLWFKNAYIN